ncbi:XRE family transcriptional regulator [Motilibacter rhizosphaerae]|uniref:XRE family transcriptional regulator n=1 Tax=Motilibacter rhizosphaerae TaxID=598652 RepID=A0A4Q7NSN1_9ACTN|nr:XRE family transcriptional regulator [Motilibacter rhizosphaerae]RZS89382.1 XRE family transcriptional regulator [Motilibacter rhizosphaerae]
MPDADAVAAAVARNTRRLRQERGWTLEVLAGRAGLSKGMLVQVEQARTNPSLQTLCRLAEAIGVTLARLVELDEAPAVRVVSADQAAVLWRQGESRATLLVGSDRREHVELWEWVLAPGQVHESEEHAPGTQELLHVLEGALLLEVDGTTHRVGTGGAAVFQADRGHAYRSAGETALRFTMTVVQPESDLDPAVFRSAAPDAQS